MNNRHYTKVLSAAIAIAGIAAAMPAFAQDAPPTQDSMPPTVQETMPPTTTAPASQMSFAQADADHDGMVSKGEATASAQLSASFDGLDADGNGSLNSAEYAKYAGMPRSGAMDNGTTNDASDMSDDGSNDGASDDTKKDEGTPVPESH